MATLTSSAVRIALRLAKLLGISLSLALVLAFTMMHLSSSPAAADEGIRYNHSVTIRHRFIASHVRTIRWWDYRFNCSGGSAYAAALAGEYVDTTTCRTTTAIRYRHWVRVIDFRGIVVTRYGEDYLGNTCAALVYGSDHAVLSCAGDSYVPR